ncbi:hypothetical protein BLA6860_00264 [Burkholderia lata]|uniref:phosphotransferase n=1 Tax=Burkholderia lata (strain ATCC 17760 / DSM 23089 / LMG 22485 / NCIMB 9086 / R18194 / 383) TaxID=482957 RepID=UPI0014536A40|nr:phosphotransferase [Burkholderia lata]VWB09513.1 hypothetical protein BLA6860_00264 [Burkholderia lata]
MTYPSLERYQEVLQFPKAAFRGDAELGHGTVATDGFGLPLVMCGGFALTYTFTLAQKRKIALRCFHKESRDLEHRYVAVSAQLKTLKSPYFVQFSFEKTGIWVDGATYPIVKMEWATGVTLGEFVEQYYDDRLRLAKLIDALRRLAQYLESQGIAHGDIQPGNVMVSDDGASVTLVDYDGMFVPALAGMQSAELGHRNFQHPGRDQTLFNAKLDRFSFISLDLALRALCVAPQLWGETHSDADSFVFRANDFSAPQASAVFASLSRIGDCARDVANFATICLANVGGVPSLAEFLLGASIPSGPKYFAPELHAQFARGRYLPVHPVIDASNFDAAFKELGEIVELVGRVVAVKPDGKTKTGRPFAFVNFGKWNSEDSVRLTIWSQVLLKMKVRPEDSWENQWISIKGLLQKVPGKGARTTLHIVVSSPTQIHHISEEEARYRLDSDRYDVAGGSSLRVPVVTTNNAKLLAGMDKGQSAIPAPAIQRASRPPVSVSASPVGPNAQRLAKMKAQQQPSTVSFGSGPRPPQPAKTAPKPPPPKPMVRQNPPSPKTTTHPVVQPAQPQHSQQPSASTPKYQQTPFKPASLRQGMPRWAYVVCGACLLVLVLLVRR